MKFLFVIVLLLAISILGSRLTFLNRRVSLGFRNIILTGTEYILIGVLLGGMGLNILDGEALKKLEPFLIFGLCWIGFLFGLQFEVRKIKNLPGAYFSIAAIQSFTSFAVVSAAMILIFKQFMALSDNVILIIALTLGSSASCTAQSALAIVNKNYRFQNRRLLDLMRYISSVDGIYALVFFALALCIFPRADISSFNLFGSMKWLFVSVIMGVIPALILISLNRLRFSSQEFILFLIGTATLCGGLAYQLHYSPLISGFVCGVITANCCRHRLRALSIVMGAEKSLYIILLILLGASWHLRVDITLVITGVYFMARIFGKLIGGFMGTKLFKHDYHVPPTIGLGLISEGGLAVAIIINFQLLHPSIADPLITIIVLSVFINEFFSPWFILARFDKKDREAVNTIERQHLKGSSQKR
ncbi:MAG: cation:proton antiporter [Candidatus Aminicenantes bacterium]|nr:MAG: cation:proton antiporter [Candidatus Aminicenantes bacterium]